MNKQQWLRAGIGGLALIQAVPVWTAPYWTPVAGNIIGAAANTAWTSGSSFIAAHPNSLWVGAAAMPTLWGVRKAGGGGGHH